MEIYNPKDWFRILFQLHKSDTMRKLFPLILIIAVYSALAVFLEKKYVVLTESDPLSNLYLFHSLLGFALSLLLVFRTNTAYDRWWEGRKLWGDLVNNSRNLSLKLHALLPADDTEYRAYFRKMIPLYAKVLKEHLQLSSTINALSRDKQEDNVLLNTSRHAPNQIAYFIYQKALELNRKDIITGEQLLSVNAELTALTNICGACERIKNTPIPYSYSAFMKKFIFVYVMTLPFGYVYSLSYWVIPVVAMVFYVLASLELIAEEIEDPFGMDENDLPMDQIARNINKHVGEIFEP